MELGQKSQKGFVKARARENTPRMKKKGRNENQDAKDSLNIELRKEWLHWRRGQDERRAKGWFKGREIYVTEEV